MAYSKSAKRDGVSPKNSNIISSIARRQLLHNTATRRTISGTFNYSTGGGCIRSYDSFIIESTEHAARHSSSVSAYHFSTIRSDRSVSPAGQGPIRSGSTDMLLTSAGAGVWVCIISNIIISEVRLAAGRCIQFHSDRHT